MATPQALTQVQDSIKSAMGLGVTRHDDGAWFFVINGEEQPVSAENAQTFEVALAQAQTNLEVEQKTRQAAKSGGRTVGKTRTTAIPQPPVPVFSPHSAADSPTSIPKVAQPAGLEISDPQPAASVVDSTMQSGPVSAAGFRFADDPAGDTLAPAFRLAPDTPYVAPKSFDTPPLAMPAANPSRFAFASDTPDASDAIPAAQTPPPQATGRRSWAERAKRVVAHGYEQFKEQTGQVAAQVAEAILPAPLFAATQSLRARVARNRSASDASGNTAPAAAGNVSSRPQSGESATPAPLAPPLSAPQSAADSSSGATQSTAQSSTQIAVQSTTQSAPAALPAGASPPNGATSPANATSAVVPNTPGTGPGRWMLKANGQARFAKAGTPGAVWLPFKAADPAPAAAPASADVPISTAGAPTPATGGISLADAQAQQRADAAVRKAAGMNVRRSAVGGFQARAAGQWQDLADDDAAKLQKTYDAALNPSWLQRAGQNLRQGARQGFGQLRGQLGMAVGAILPAATLGATAYGVHSIQDQAGDAAQAIVRGAATAPLEAVRVGGDIAKTLLESIGSAIGGKSGEAFARVGGQIVDSLTHAVRGALDTAGNLLGAGARLIGGAAGGVLAVGGAAVGGAVGMSIGGAVGGVSTLAAGGVGALPGALGGLLPGALLGAAIGTAAGAIAMRLVSAVSDAVGGLIGTVGHALGAVGDVATGVFKGALDALTDIASVTDRWAGRIATISAQTGLSSRVAGAAALSFGSLGLGGTLGNIAGAPGNNPAIYGMKAGIWGLPSYSDPMAPVAFAAKYQQLQRGGFMGQQMAGMMAQQAGYNTPEGMRISQIAPEKLAAQVTWAQNTAGSLGLDPEAIKNAGDDIYLLQNKISTFTDLLKLKIGQELLPYLSSVLDKAINYVSAHGSEIGDFIKKAVAWLIEDMPPMLMRAGAAGLEALGTFAGGISWLAETLLKSLPAIMTGVDTVLDGLRSFVVAAAGVGAAIVKIAENVVAMIENMLSGGAATTSTGTGAAGSGTTTTAATTTAATTTAATTTAATTTTSPDPAGTTTSPDPAGTTTSPDPTGSKTSSPDPAGTTTPDPAGTTTPDPAGTAGEKEPEPLNIDLDALLKTMPKARHSYSPTLDEYEPGNSNDAGFSDVVKVGGRAIKLVKNLPRLWKMAAGAAVVAEGVEQVKEDYDANPVRTDVQLTTAGAVAARTPGGPVAKVGAGVVAYYAAGKAYDAAGNFIGDVKDGVKSTFKDATAGAKEAAAAKRAKVDNWLGHPDFAAKYGNPDDPNNPVANTLKTIDGYAKSLDAWAKDKASSLRGGAESYAKQFGGGADSKGSDSHGSEAKSVNERLLAAIERQNQILERVRENTGRAVSIGGLTDHILQESAQDEALSLVSSRSMGSS